MSKENRKLMKECSSLLNICNHVARTREALEKGDYAIIQGTLRYVFNSLGELVYNLQFSEKDELRNKLIAINEFVYDSRDRLVDGMEVQRKDLGNVVEGIHLNERLSLIEGVLKQCIEEKYT